MHEQVMPLVRDDFAVLLSSLVLANGMPGQVPATPTTSTPDPEEQPHSVSLCDIAKDPATFNHKLIRVTTFVSHGFEDFTLADPSCGGKSYNFQAWLMYGDQTQSNTVYCCPGEGGAGSRPKPLSVEGIPTSLVGDSTFGEFTELLKKERDTTVRATLVGRFFSGEKEAVRGSTHWSGYGHLRCCSLLVVQRVEAFEPHRRTDVDYSAEAGWYEADGCVSGSMRYLRHVSISFGDDIQQTIAEQRTADSGERAWAFDDPLRVAVESLKLPAEQKAPVLQKVRSTPSREVFRWKRGKKVTTIVVIRPYWLSFFAEGNRVVWVSATVKEAECT